MPICGRRASRRSGRCAGCWKASPYPCPPCIPTTTSSRSWNTHGHRNRVRSLAFAPSGRLLASAGNDGSIMLWSLTDPAAAPQPRGTLLGLPEGWVAFTPDGRYKTEGLTAGQFWHVIGLCRFEAGELDPYLPQIRQMELDDPL
ncbi:WD40 repeat domain-containing protein [Nocardia sp. NPDC059239]|uniref:WD40 repeat domain-containing protein n=1 Tax=unclassified Nocardia TaxID=2637762 RepID=UPI00369EE6A2